MGDPAVLDVVAQASAAAAAQAAEAVEDAPAIAGAITDQPTQQGPRGLRFDFNDGCRVAVPDNGRPWHIRISDLDTGNVLFETEIQAGRINSTKRYYVRFRLEAWQEGERLLAHDYDARDREVLIRLPVATLGDPLGWFPYAVKFQEAHKCRLTCAMDPKMIEILRPGYPHINFITEEEIEPSRYYATYSIAVYFLRGGMYDHRDRAPCDYRFVGLHRSAGYTLGVDPAEVPPMIALDDDSRPVAEP